ncbi:hypothetical protein [Algoriphagus winogradskyi]|uniref:Uncharacterized protein n=1 Tax=Algoriphagus winogradskyi TaxID=237017 RepID=A0ABY1NMB8_9BACT|nr:hypothetical protein [Algoriphagus winogradskyi]SMP13077.1 hypothetical protein SAMN06265367_102177 [Algoriphagus winogradskyi]|tara:strand:+ start:7840 stop:8058 length:219 start_codon:yes stop_codon:yes gene_type:complete
MKITLEIKDNKASAFLNFIKSLDFIQIKSEENLDEPSKAELLENVADGIREVKEYEAGNRTMKSAKAFLDEL